MNIKPIRSNADYKRAVKRIETLMGAKVGTPQGDELDILATLVDAWEAKFFPIDPPDAVEAILYRMEQLGLERKDLEPIIGHKGRVSEVLNRKRSLSIEMIRNLHRELNIPLEALVA
jgi:HTH-type transcriptional regulator/antitoxin HigA